MVFFHGSSMMSDWNLTLQLSSEKREESQPSCGNVDEDELSSCRHVAIGELSLCRHVAIGEPSDRRHLSLPFAHVMDLMIAWTRVHAISTVPTESHAHRAAMRRAELRAVWKHCPTRKKKRKVASLN